MHEFFEMLARRATAAPDLPAVVAPAVTLSYAQLVSRVRAVAAAARALPQRVGLLVGAAADGIIADLALSFAGKEIVPLPSFFSDAQVGHVVRACGLSHLVTDAMSAERARGWGLTVTRLAAAADIGGAPAAEARRIIFTSGSTGCPKGVRLSSRQVLASVAAQAAATAATASDRYLSLLPNALLLEQIAGLYLPLSVGASIHVVAPAALRDSIARAVEQAEATATVLVPELLEAWVSELEQAGRCAPPSLRFVAAGGAPVSRELASAAWRLGIPVHEGYGLSECCSVVAVNRVGDRGAGTVGRPLDGIGVSIRDGEIVVSGPTIMDGYLAEADVSGAWSTGDLGRVDADGWLVVTGRKDNLIVTGAGRNVSPEWIENHVAAPRALRRCVVVEHRGDLVAVVTPLNDATDARPCVADLLARATLGLPDYAKPRRCLVLTEQELFTPNGRPRRAAIRDFAAARRASLRDVNFEETIDVEF